MKDGRNERREMLDVRQSGAGFNEGTGYRLRALRIDEAVGMDRREASLHVYAITP